MTQGASAGGWARRVVGLPVPSALPLTHSGAVQGWASEVSAWLRASSPGSSEISSVVTAGVDRWGLLTARGLSRWLADRGG